MYIYIYIYIFFFFSFSLQCWSIYPKFQFLLFINFLLWSSAQFYSHHYISKTKKNIYSFINQILQLKKKVTLPRGRTDVEFFFMAMALHIKVSCITQMVYFKVMTWMMLHNQRDADIYIYIYIYIFFFFSFSLQCWSIYPNFQFSLFINFLLWSSAQFYSHYYISKRKNIYNFINQILQLWW